MNEIKSLRKANKLTQKQAADMLGISVRSYKTYENDAKKEGTLKYNYIVEKFMQLNLIDEEHGVVDVPYITERCEAVFKNYDVEYCYLFGSYAKGSATETSDIDLLISTQISGLKFYGLVEELRSSLHKRVDVLNLSQLKDNIALANEILRDGIKIYG